MALFPAKPSTASFWEWWAQGGAATVNRLLAEAEPRAAEAEVGARIPHRRPPLAWELGGTPGDRRLVVRADGVPGNRAAAERWRRAAVRTAGWTFATARPPRDIDGATLTAPGFSGGLALADIRWRFASRPTSLVAHVDAYHPSFASMSPRAAQEVAELALRFALGDDDVDRWIREVSVMIEPAEHLAELGAVREGVRRLGELRDLEPWFIFRDDEDGDPFSGRRSRQRPVDIPLLDTHTMASYRYAVSGPPSTSHTAVLDGIESAWADMPGRIELLAVGEGSGQRIWHFYSDGTDRGARDHLRTWLRERGPFSVRSRHDPGWTDLG